MYSVVSDSRIPSCTFILVTLLMNLKSETVWKMKKSCKITCTLVYLESCLSLWLLISVVYWTYTIEQHNIIEYTIDVL